MSAVVACKKIHLIVNTTCHFDLDNQKTKALPKVGSEKQVKESSGCWGFIWPKCVIEGGNLIPSVGVVAT